MGVDAAEEDEDEGESLESVPVSGGGARADGKVAVVAIESGRLWRERPEVWVGEEWVVSQMEVDVGLARALCLELASTTTTTPSLDRLCLA